METLKQPHFFTTARTLAKKHFPSHKRISESHFKDFSEAFNIMPKEVIKKNLSVISETIWSFRLYDTVFFTVILNAGLAEEDAYFGMLETN